MASQLSLLRTFLVCFALSIFLVGETDAWRRRRRRRSSPPPPPPPPPDTTAPTFTYCPGNIGNQHTTSTSRTVTWTTPTATDDRGSPSVSRTSGSSPGSRFSEGSHSAVYTATDGAGNRATCTISFVVVVISCTTLSSPGHGSISCTNSRNVGSMCTYSCSTGYRLSGGSTSRTCTASGTSATWPGSAPSCARITCSSLSSPSHGSVSCTDQRYYNSRCTYSCDGGYTLQSGSTTRTCMSSGSWTGSTPNCADTTDPTFRQCPSSQIIYAPNLATSATATWSLPTVSDNSGESISPSRVQGSASGSPLNEGVHPVRYTAEDSAGNSAECSFSITIAVVRCTSLSGSSPLQVSCPNGNIRGSVCTYSCSTGYRLQGQGSTECQKSGSSGSWDSAAPSCQTVPCIDLAIPAHGALACDDGFAYGRYCTMMCDTRYDIPRLRSSQAPQKIFICGTSGTWHPHSNVPDCSALKNPSRIKLPLDIMYFGGKCAVNDEQTRQEISQKYIDIISQTDFAEVCTKNHLCTADNVDVTCGAGNDRQKRSISNENRQRLDVSDLSNADDHITVISMVLRMMPADTDGEQYTMSQDGIPEQQYHHRLVELAHHIHNNMKGYSLDNGRGQQISDGEATETERQSADVNSVLLHDTVTVECDMGYIPNHEQHTCIACPTGHYFDGAATECIECELGFYQDEHAQSECKPCVDGTWTREKGAKHASQCEVKCEQGHYSATGFAPCIQCDQGEFQPVRGQTECFDCPVGLITSSTGSTSVEDCQEPCHPGHFSLSGLQPCKPCPLGSYQPHPQHTTCRECGGNTTTTSEAATAIEQCHISN